MAKAELGTKRACAHCGAKFYDLSKDPIVCPKCGTMFEVPAAPRGRSGAAVPAQVQQEEEAPAVAEAEFVSLEEADAEAQGKKGAALPDVDVEVEDDEDMDDSTFLETEEDEGDDVSDIIGETIEDDEET